MSTHSQTSLKDFFISHPFRVFIITLVASDHSLVCDDGFANGFLFTFITRGFNLFPPLAVALRFLGEGFNVSFMFIWLITLQVFEVEGCG